MKFRKLFYDLFVVIFGVTVAFLLSEWAVSQREKSNTRQVLKSIVQEMDENAEYLRKQIGMQDSMLQKMKQYDARLNSGEEFSSEEMQLYYGKLVLNRTNFDLAKSTGTLAKINLDDALKISKCYQIMEEVKKLEGRIIDIFYEGVDSKKDYEKALFWIQSVQDAEKLLEKKFRETVSEIRSDF